MKTRVKPDSTQRTLALVAAVVAVVNILSLALDPRDARYLLLEEADIAHGVLCLVVAAIAARPRGPWSLRTADLIFVLIVSPFIIGLWLPQSYDASHGALFDPLLAHRFLVLGIAVSAPSWRSGTAMIIVMTLHAILLWQYLDGTPAGGALEREPVFTIFFGLIAGLLLYIREGRRDLEARLVATEARAKALTQVSRVLLALRDRANTPLQTLEVAIALLEDTGGSNDPVLVPMRRALARLTSIQQTLATTAALPFDLDVSLDLEAALAELMTDRDSRPAMKPPRA